MQQLLYENHVSAENDAIEGVTSIPEQMRRSSALEPTKRDQDIFGDRLPRQKRHQTDDKAATLASSLLPSIIRPICAVEPAQWYALYPSAGWPKTNQTPVV